MKIVKASISELDEVSRLFDDYRVFYDQEPDFEGAKEYIKERMSKNESVIFLAMNDNNEGMGFIQLYPSFTSIGMKRLWILNDLYVDIIHRKNKVAEQLIDKCKELVRETNSAGLVLETQNENKPAQNLYFKSGFIKDDMHSNFFWKKS
ncbi:MAG: GNAT family N-acetyltransferase [Ignavibacteria bacterium]